MAFPALSQITNPTVFQDLMLSNSLAGVFSVYLTPNPNEVGSALILGGIDTALVPANSTWDYSNVLTAVSMVLPSQHSSLLYSWRRF
jgi:hypothetical protein